MLDVLFKKLYLKNLTAETIYKIAVRETDKDTLKDYFNLICEKKESVFIVKFFEKFPYITNQENLFNVLCECDDIFLGSSILKVVALLRKEYISQFVDKLSTTSDMTAIYKYIINYKNILKNNEMKKLIDSLCSLAEFYSNFHSIWLLSIRIPKIYLTDLVNTIYNSQSIVIISLFLTKHKDKLSSHDILKLKYALSTLEKEKYDSDKRDLKRK